jgi:hypothetical protein
MYLLERICYDKSMESYESMDLSRKCMENLIPWNNLVKKPNMSMDSYECVESIPWNRN